MSRVVIRRLGSNRWHLANVHPRSLVEGEVFGAPAMLVVPPIVTLCGTKLRGNLVATTTGYGETVNADCAHCQLADRG